LNTDISVQKSGRDWVLQTSLWLPRPRTEVFDFFSDAFNLEAITPSFLRFRVVTPGPIDMRRGALIDYRLRVRGVPISWRTEIAVWEPEHRFVDTQIRGPYAKWWHEHAFEEKDGGTLCTDRVEYRPPGGPLAPIVNAVAVQRDVVSIFRHRHRELADRFGTPADTPAVEPALAGAS
jgi:ligand-binding SRPBCC domain-containing protein